MISNIVASLKACAKHKDLQKGSRVHADILQSGLLRKNAHVASTLVNMYAKCGALTKAAQVVEELSARNVVIWNALISGYAQHRRGEDALKCFDQMLGEGLSPDAVTYTCILKACSSMGAFDKAQQIHHDIRRLGLLEKEIMVGNSLVDMYAKCGALEKAECLLDELPIRDNVSWNALIAGYTQQELGDEALKCFDRMQCEGLSADIITFTCTLRACGIVRAIHKGEQIHSEIVQQGLLGKETVLGNTLIDMYLKCGELERAARVLDELSVRNLVSWNSLIAGYVQQGQNDEALNCYERMQDEGLSPNAVTFTSILKACSSKGKVDKGEEIHKEIIRHGLFGKDILLGNTLVDMYAKGGALTKAAAVLKELPIRNVVSWSALIAGYAQSGQGEDALSCFEQMQREGLSPNIITYISILQACGDVGAADKGEQIHNEIVRHDLLCKDVVLANSLVEMYTKCGALAKAAEVLHELPCRNVISWNALITGYVQQGQGEEALKCLGKLQQDGLSANAVTYVRILKACGSIGAVAKGEQIHEEIVRCGLLEADTILGNVLVDMYAKCGAFTKAEQVLDELPARGVVSWSALIAGYSQQEHGEEALRCFEQMQCEGIFPNIITYICVLDACGSIGALDKGKQLHEDILAQELLEKDIVLGNALVDMYAKCGALDKAAEAIVELPARNVVTWSALIAGYAHQGQGKEALECFDQMQCEGLFPNAVTFGCLLMACGRSGLLNEAQMYFENMNSKYNIAPLVAHHTCMVGLFGAAGELDNALAVIKKMPSFNHLPAWLSLLAHCVKWGNVTLGRLAFINAVRIDRNDGASYMLLSRLYAAVGMPEDAYWLAVTESIRSLALGKCTP